jgi:hypothetical protein
MNELIFREEVYRVVGAALEDTELGEEFLESVYQDAMGVGACIGERPVSISGSAPNQVQGSSIEKAVHRGFDLFLVRCWLS